MTLRIKKNIAMPVDEWGGTSGLVTLEDVVEGNSWRVSDPYDKEEYSFREISDDKYIVEGAIKIYDLEENIEVKFPEVREYDTLAGYIFDAMGDIPKINEKVTFQDYSFKVIELTKNRIDKVEIKKNDNDRLVNIIKKLRAPNGCEWDKKQTHESLIQHLIEETYEVVESIEDKNYKLLKKDLGDLLLHVIFQIDIANDNKEFNLDDVIDGICEKLIEKHPHIFYDKKDPRYKEENWEVSKKERKKTIKCFRWRFPKAPQLIRSSRIQEKAASVGFDWDDKNQVLLKVDEEILELKDAILKNDGIDEEIGDVLFTIVNLSRHMGYDAESSLKKSIDKFSKRFKKIEQDLKIKNINIQDLSLEDLDKIWNRNKLDE